MWHHCVLWIIWGDIKVKTFDGVENTILIGKQRMSRFLYDQITVLDIPSCTFLEFLSILYLTL